MASCKREKILCWLNILFLIINTHYKVNLNLFIYCLFMMIIDILFFTMANHILQNYPLLHWQISLELKSVWSFLFLATNNCVSELYVQIPLYPETCYVQIRLTFLIESILFYCILYSVFWGNYPKLSLASDSELTMLK